MTQQKAGIQVRCLCGKVSTLHYKEIVTCPCGCLLGIEYDEGMNFRPVASIPEGYSLPGKYNRPKILGEMIS